MALNIKDPETEQLAAEVAAMAGESKTRAVKVALHERKERLKLLGKPADRGERLRRLLEEEIWPNLPAEERGRPMSKAEREEILGYGPNGV